MKQKLCAEYLRISDEEAARLVEVAAPAATSDGGTAGLVNDGAERLSCSTSSTFRTKMPWTSTPTGSPCFAR